MSTSFAELNRQVVFGRAGGRIVWQPRIVDEYNARQGTGAA